MKTKIEPELKVKHPVSILLPLTFPAIAASIARSHVRLVADSYLWPLERCVFSMTEKIFARKISKQLKQNENFFFSRGVRGQSNTVTQKFFVIEQPDAATKKMTAGSTAQKKLHVP